MENTALEDVGVFYYPETSKQHDLGLIAFRGEVDKLIDFDRVLVDVTGDIIYFKKDPHGKGLKLSNSKIQLWSLAFIAKTREGQYPLKHDIQHGCYCIRREDAKPLASDKPSRLGQPVNYTPHVRETPQPTSEPEAADHRPPISIVDNKHLQDDKPIRKSYSKKQITEFYIKDKIIELLVAGRPGDSTTLANALKIIQREDE